METTIELLVEGFPWKLINEHLEDIVDMVLMMKSDKEIVTTKSFLNCNHNYENNKLGNIYVVSTDRKHISGYWNGASATHFINGIQILGANITTPRNDFGLNKNCIPTYFTLIKLKTKLKSDSRKKLLDTYIFQYVRKNCYLTVEFNNEISLHSKLKFRYRRIRVLVSRNNK